MIISMLENGSVIKKDCIPPDFDYVCDVLCVGAGSAGCYAADAASEEGANVILCEIGENIGGMHVCGNVTGYYYGNQGGSYEEDDAKTKTDTVFLTNKRHWEQRQIRLTERLLKSGVKILCRHSIIGLYINSDRVIGVLAFDGKNEISIKADITVDATSDGHLIRMTDVKKRYGRPSDEKFVPFGVFLQYTKDNGLCFKNNDSGITDHYDITDFSEKTIMAHANAVNLLKNEEIVNCALHTGIREGLSYEGEDSVSYKNLLLNKQPEKILFWAYADLDRHGSLRAIEEEMFQNWWVISNLSTVTLKIPVPMGSVVPKDIKGLLTAGRCLSCDTYSQSALRMNRDMFRMGECIGVAAAMAVSEGVDFLEIDHQKYLSRVRQRNCFDGKAHGIFGFDNSYKMYLNKMNALNRVPDKKYDKFSPNKSIYESVDFDVEKTFDLLETDAPGVAVWSCYLNAENSDLRARLCKEMSNSKSILYKYNCAIALGLIGDERALPVLREIVQKRDCFFFTDNRRSNQFRSAIAICLLGRIGNEKDVSLLSEILTEDEINRPMYHTLEANYLYHSTPDRNFVYFAMLTHACMAIYKIYNRHALCMDELHSFFAKLFSDGAVLKRVTNTAPGETAYEEMNDLIEYMLRITAPALPIEFDEKL